MTHGPLRGATAVLLCAFAAASGAEEDFSTAAMPERIDEGAMLMTAPPPLPLGGGDALMFLQFEMAGPDDVVPGKPYAAELVVVTHQPLIDGNSISVEHRSRVYRDSAGRTRRDEQIGPPQARRQHVVITDPVAGRNYILEPERRLAHELPLAPLRTADLAYAANAQAPVTVAATSDAVFDIALPASPDARTSLFEAPLPAAAAGPSGGSLMLPFPGEPATTDLGARVLDGIEVSGTRTTVTIPAGAIGNRAPIAIVTEQWFSADLGLVVESAHRDPRVGETHYRLRDLRLGEPDPALFTIPADYAVLDPVLNPAP